MEKAALAIVGTLSGLVAGVAVGILTAPCKGKETRVKVAESANNLRKVILGFRARTGHSVEDVKQLLNQEIQGINPEVKQHILDIIESSERKKV